MAECNFKDRVIQKLGCAPEAYEKAVFRHCLHSHAVLLAQIFYWLSPGMFEKDMYLIQRSATAKTVEEVCDHVKSFRHIHNNEHERVFHDLLNIRVSGRKMIRLAEQVLEDQT